MNHHTNPIGRRVVPPPPPLSERPIPPPPPSQPPPLLVLAQPSSSSSMQSSTNPSTITTNTTTQAAYDDLKRQYEELKSTVEATRRRHRPYIQSSIVVQQRQQVQLGNGDDATTTRSTMTHTTYEEYLESRKRQYELHNLPYSIDEYPLRYQQYQKEYQQLQQLLQEQRALYKQKQKQQQSIVLSPPFLHDVKTPKKSNRSNRTTRAKATKTSSSSPMNRFFCLRPSPIRFDKLIGGQLLKRLRRPKQIHQQGHHVVDSFGVAATAEASSLPRSPASGVSSIIKSTSIWVDPNSGTVSVAGEESTLGIQRNPLSLVSCNRDDKANNNITTSTTPTYHDIVVQNEYPSFITATPLRPVVNTDIVVNPTSLARYEATPNDGRLMMLGSDGGSDSVSRSGDGSSYSSASNYFLTSNNGNCIVEYYTDDSWANVSMASSLSDSAHRNYHSRYKNFTKPDDLNVDDTWSSTTGSHNTNNGSSHSGSISGSGGGSSSTSSNSSRFVLHRRGGNGGNGGGSYYHGHRRGRLDSYSTSSSSLFGIAILEEGGDGEDDDENTISDTSLYTISNPSYYDSSMTSSSSSSQSLTTNPSPVVENYESNQRRIITINDRDIDNYGIMAPPLPPPTTLMRTRSFRPRHDHLPLRNPGDVGVHTEVSSTNRSLRNGNNSAHPDHFADDIGLVAPPPPAFQRRIPSNGLTPLTPTRRRAPSIQLPDRGDFQSPISESRNQGNKDDVTSSSHSSSSSSTAVRAGSTRFEI